LVKRDGKKYLIQNKTPVLIYSIFRINERFSNFSIKSIETITVIRKNEFFVCENFVHRTSPRDDDQRPSTQEMRDPFALQPHSKDQVISALNAEKNWQTIVQQQQSSNSYSTQFPSRSARLSGSITQGSPISSSLRVSTDQQQYPSSGNNQLVNPRYSPYVNKSNQ
jgi:hypothetical protein